MSARDGVRRRVARGALVAFGRLPRRVRRTLVRLWAPSYTVGAMGVVLDGDRVLLARHAYRAGWSAPGGLLGRGEQPQRTAVREVLEEVGLDVELVRGPVPVVWPALRRIDFVHLARLASDQRPEDAQATSVELTEVAWFALDALPDLDAATAEGLTALGLGDLPPATYPA